MELKAQQNECGMPASGSSFPLTATPPCDNSISYSPPFDNDEHVPTKAIRVTVHVLNSHPNSTLPAGCFNVPDNAVNRTYIKDRFFGRLNTRLRQNADPREHSTSPHVPNNRFQLEVVEILFHDDPRQIDDWDLINIATKCGTLTFYDSRYYDYYVVNGNCTYPYNSIHVFFGKKSIAATGCACDIGCKKWVLTEDFDNAWAHWKWTDPSDSAERATGTLLHEFGHAWGLIHNFCFSPCGCSDNDGCLDTPEKPHCGVLNGTMGSGCSTTDCPDCSDLECVHNNVMAYGDSLYAFTECQLGKMHFNFYENNGDLLDVWREDYCAHDPNATITIENGEDITWLSTKYLYGNLVIEAGGKLTIKCTVSMPPDGKIIVKRGAALVVDGGKITNVCGDKMWAGVEVWGNSLFAQAIPSVELDPNHGTVILRNAGTLEYAKLAISTRNGNLSGYGGGRIFVTDGKFLDVRRAVEFRSYKKPNRSFFVNCLFDCRGPLPDPVYVDQYQRPLGVSTFVTLWDVNGVRFEGNTFRNSGTFDADIRGTAIYSLDASYHITQQCTTWNSGNCSSGIPNTFTGLRQGIWHGTGNAAGYVVITDNVFNNNYQNIILSGSVFSLVQNNTISNIPDWSYIPLGNGYMQTSFGIYGLIGHGNKVWDNVVTCASTGNYLRRGILSWHAGAYGYEVQRNTLDGFIVGVQAMGSNHMMDVTCNEFEEGYGLAVTGGVFPDQGQCITGNFKTPAGNDFDLNISNGKGIHFQNTINANPIFGGAKVLGYYHHATSVSYPNITPTNYTNFILQGQGAVLFPCNEQKISTSCDDPYSGNGTGALKARLALINEEISAAYSVVDGGNTAAMISFIDPATNHSSVEIRDELLGNSPSSEVVLLAAVNRNPRLDEEDLREILVENSLLPTSLVSAIESLDPPLSQATLDLVDSAQTHLSDLYLITSGIRDLQREQRGLINEIVTRYWLDDTLEAPISFLDSLGDSASIMASIPFETMLGNLAEAGSKTGYISGLDENLENFSAIQEVFISLEESGRTYWEMDSVEIAQIRAVGLANIPASAYAWNILEFVFGEKYELRIDSIIDPSEKKGSGIPQNGSAKTGSPWIGQCYPHPVSESTMIPVFVPDSNELPTIQISSMLTGKMEVEIEVRETGYSQLEVNTIGWSNGIYLYSLTIDQQRISTRKLVLIR